uniref:Calcineurin-like phosphoesterase domain-containing protein n=1 Tax=Chlorobium chlorochromatii (strain CaD3) TaxID=340177 RepID=Q3AQ55_CHLCH
MKIVQFVAMLLLFAGVNGAVVYRLWRLMPPLRWFRGSVTLLLLAVIAAPFVVMAWGNALPLPLVSLLYMVGLSWLILLIYLILLFLLIDGLSLLGFFGVQRLKSLKLWTHESWVGTVGVVVLMAVLAVYGNYNYHQKERVELTMRVEKAMAQPLRIVVVSDLHLGYSIGREELERWVVLINREEPDVVLLVGDVIDTSLRPLEVERMAEVLRRLSSRYGVYAVAGNHEHYATLAKSAPFFSDAGIRLLRDEVLLIDNRCYFVGRDDYMNKQRKPLSVLLSGVDVAKPIVLLDHQPRALGEARAAGADIHFAGHTHRGQIWPISLLVEQMYEQAYGYRRFGAMQSYVSSGLGIWGGKFRIGTKSEYVVVTLQGR